MHALVEMVQKTWQPSRWEGTRILVAVSGGADSVALLLALSSLSSDPTQWIDVGHFNHQWRGMESDADEEFVRNLCATMGLRFCVGHAKDYPVNTGDRSEESARRARYHFLAETAYQVGARYVATAHTASDRVETLLHNLFRGTGLAGMCSPTLVRDFDEDLVLVRPLLACSRMLVEQFLDECGQTYRCDSSNSDITYRRNFLRQEVLPLVRQVYGSQADERVLALSEIVEETVGMQEQLARDYLIQVEALLLGSSKAAGTRSETAGGFVFPKRERLDVLWPILRQALYLVWLQRKWPLQGMTRDHWRVIRDAWATPTGGLGEGEGKILGMLPGELQLIDLGRMLSITPLGLNEVKATPFSPESAL